MLYAETSAGLTWPTHPHEGVEVVAFIKGEGIFTIDGEERVVGPLDVVVIPPGVPHPLRVTEDAEMVGITIPANGGYPGGKRGGDSGP